MQDLSVNDLADELRELLIEQGMVVPRTTVRRMTRHFFRYVEKIASKGEERISLRKRDIEYIYPRFDVKKLCDELAIGEDPKIMTVEYLHRKGKLSRPVAQYEKRRQLHLEEELE